MTKDLNRNISGITYNSLNLPSKATFTNGSTIAYTYLVDGTKLKTVRTIGDATTTTDYCGNAVYENGTLKFLLTDEGYITPDDGKYHYYLTDHLGNNRVIVGQTGNVEEVNHYYPFGGMFANSDVQPYKYNGKEWDEDSKWYDYGARSYDPTLGRFNTMDPMAERYYSVSPYAYCGNNPINRIDPTGMVWEDPDDADRLKKKIDKKIESLNEDIEKWQSKIDDGNLKDKKLAKLNRKLDEAKERISNLQQSKKDIDLLGEDMEHIYAFNQIDGGKHQVWQGENGIIYIDTSSDALSIHEVTHVRQSLTDGELIFHNGMLQNVGSKMPNGEARYKKISDMEVEAYQMQYSYDRSFPGRTKNLQGIDIHSVGNIENGNIYPAIRAYSDFLKQRARILK